METHWPSSQVNCPEPQAVTLTLISLEAREEVQGSSCTREKSNMWIPNSREASSESNENISLRCVIMSHEPHQHFRLFINLKHVHVQMQNAGVFHEIVIKAVEPK